MAQLTLVLLQLNVHKKDIDDVTKQEVQMLKLHSCLFTPYLTHTAVFAALLCSPKNHRYSLFACDLLKNTHKQTEKYSFCRRVLTGNGLLFIWNRPLIWSQLISLYTTTKFICWSLNSLLRCDYQIFFNFNFSHEPQGKKISVNRAFRATFKDTRVSSKRKQD